MKITAKGEIDPQKKLSNAEFIALLLKQRGITDTNAFLHPVSPLTLTLRDFGYDQEINKSVELLKKARHEGNYVVVYTDYDADGITGGSIVWETLHLLGFKVMPYVPHRKHEGYGFSIKGIDKVKHDFNPALIISVDHGITAVDQIAYAKSIGIPVIVTDHHHKQDRIPEAAEAIFHIPLLSGSGVGYFFAKEMWSAFRKIDGFIPKKNDAVLEKHFNSDYLSLASIGTIADLVPLVGPSRSVVKYGLDAFPVVTRAGIKHICREAQITDKTITPYEIGFVIAPRINAVGRLEHALDALRLLCTTSDQKAFELSSKVGKMNTDRQELVKTSVAQAREMVEKMKEKGDLPPIIILHSSHWHEGIIGLIASNLLEAYYRPIIIMTEGDGLMKGSARSIASFHITHFFEELREYFMNFGGHAGAAGFSLAREKLETFLEKAVEVARSKITPTDLEREMHVDLSIPVSHVSLSLAKAIESLSPFGIGNPQPSFVSEVELVSASIMGKNQNHLKLTVKDPAAKSFPLEMVAFGKGDLYPQLSRGILLKIAYQLDINRWKGRESLQGKVMHIDM